MKKRAFATIASIVLLASCSNPFVRSNDTPTPKQDLVAPKPIENPAPTEPITIVSTGGQASFSGNEIVPVTGTRIVTGSSSTVTVTSVGGSGDAIDIAAEDADVKQAMNEIDKLFEDIGKETPKKK